MNDPTGIPPTYVFTRRVEHDTGISLTAAPDSQFQKLLPEDHSWHEAPDPIRQSDYWNAGNKINAWPNMFITSHLAIGVKQSVMQDEYQIGKLLGYIHAGKQQYAGAQLPSVYRVNIQPAMSTTYGSQYTMRGQAQQGSILLATGMSYNQESSMDGYPY